MSNVIREDVIQLGFDINTKEIEQLRKEIDEIKKRLGMLDDDPFKETKESADKAKKSVNLLSKAAGAAGKALKKAAAISFKGLSIGISVAAAGIGKIAYDSVQAYADFEQLKGGVETLFGVKGATSIEEYAKITGKSVDSVKDEYFKLLEVQNTVLKDANNAYKESGLSANEYMETVTSFSASLIQSVGGNTELAASLAKTAVVDMADNANKMGTDMVMIQNAYQGFAKQNYTIELMSAA